MRGRPAAAEGRLTSGEHVLDADRHAGSRSPRPVWPRPAPRRRRPPLEARAQLVHGLRLAVLVGGDAVDDRLDGQSRCSWPKPTHRTAVTLDRMTRSVSSATPWRRPWGPPCWRRGAWLPRAARARGRRLGTGRRVARTPGGPRDRGAVGAAPSSSGSSAAGPSASRLQHVDAGAEPVAPRGAGQRRRAPPGAAGDPRARAARTRRRAVPRSHGRRTGHRDPGPRPRGEPRTGRGAAWGPGESELPGHGPPAVLDEGLRASPRLRRGAEVVVESGGLRHVYRIVATRVTSFRSSGCASSGPPYPVVPDASRRGR